MTTPLVRLQDPEFTRVIIVTLPESTPIQEAERVQADLRRAGIEPFGWVVYAGVSATGARDSVLASRALLGAAHIARVGEVANRAWVLPWEEEAPTTT